MLIHDLADWKIYLASKSPRRHELLRGMGIDFEYFPTEVDEVYPSELSPADVAEYLSQLKLSTVDMARYSPKTIFIACDTIVVLDGRILGKPRDKAEAKAMLALLAGKTHTVISGLTVATPQRKLVTHRKTEVQFARFSAEEIDFYVERYAPLDKAGAYGVQEWIGYVGINAINGSFYNVMGLPTKLLWDMLDGIVHSAYFQC